MDTMEEMLSMLLDGAVETLDISPHLQPARHRRYEEVGTWLAEHGDPGCAHLPAGLVPARHRRAPAHPHRRVRHRPGVLAADRQGDHHPGRAQAARRRHAPRLRAVEATAGPRRRAEDLRATPPLLDPRLPRRRLPPRRPAHHPRPRATRRPASCSPTSSCTCGSTATRSATPAGSGPARRSCDTV